MQNTGSPNLSGFRCSNCRQSKTNSEENDGIAGKIRQKLAHYYDENGRLTQYPTKRPLRTLALSRIAEHFSPGAEYTEKQVNQIIAAQIAFSDVELIRRELYEGGYVDRLLNGSKYWKTKTHD